MDYLGNLAADASRLREAAGRDLTAAVPGCPEWTAADLVQHVGAVYLNKAECVRRNAKPEPWPPPGLAEEEPLALFDRGYAALAGEFGSHTPEDPGWTWYPPEQTVGFWLRRMAQETVIHRVDAEQADAALAVAQSGGRGGHHRR